MNQDGGDEPSAHLYAKTLSDAPPCFEILPHTRYSALPFLLLRPRHLLPTRPAASLGVSPLGFESLAALLALASPSNDDLDSLGSHDGLRVEHGAERIPSQLNVK